MKILRIVLFAIVLTEAFLSYSLFAEECTQVIKNSNGTEWDLFTRASYSQKAACDQAIYDCNEALAFNNSIGRFLNSNCEVKYFGPRINPKAQKKNNTETINLLSLNFLPSPVFCQTDLVFNDLKIIRSFKSTGPTKDEACKSSHHYCKVSLASLNTNFGYRCIGSEVKSKANTHQSLNKFNPKHLDLSGKL